MLKTYDFDELVKERDDKAYYAKLVHAIGCEDTVEVQQPDRGTKGKGLFAKRAFGPGEVVFRERPLVSARVYPKETGHVQNQRVCCSQCLRPCLQPGDLGSKYAKAFDLLQETFPQPSPVQTCLCSSKGTCCDVYCSQQCSEEAHAKYPASFMGPGSGSELIKDVSVSAGRTNPMLIARMFAMVSRQLDKGVSPEDALRPFMRFQGHAVDDDLNDPKWLTTLQAALCSGEPSTDKADVLTTKVVTLENTRFLNAAILQNAQELHPISDLHKFLEQRDAHALVKMLNIFGLKIPQLSLFRVGQFMSNLTAMGTGMFPVANCMNHSCLPNVVSMSRSTNETLDVVAIRPIQPGDELHISYIDESEPRAQRQRKLLKYYQFTCECEKCAAA